MEGAKHRNQKGKLADRLGGKTECPLPRTRIDACGSKGVGEVELSGKTERLAASVIKLCTARTKGQRILKVPKSDLYKARKIARYCPHNIKVEDLE